MAMPTECMSPSSVEDEWFNEMLIKSAPLTTTTSFSDLQDFNEFVPTTSMGSMVDCNSLFSRESSCTSSSSSLPPVKKEDDELLDNVTSRLQQMQKRNDLTPKALESIFDTKDVLRDSVDCQGLASGRPVPYTSETPKRKRCSRRRLTASQKEAHNKVEKKYRVNINAKINCLQTVIPWITLDAMDSKVCKSTVLEKAYDYITYLRAENEALKSKLGARAN